MNICREALPYIGVGLSVGIAALLLGFPWVAGAALVLSGLIALFFRDPARKVPEGRDVIVSPADGRVMEILPDGSTGGTRISIFLSLFDVHVNRSPVEGRIERIEYQPGRYLPAQVSRASVENERNAITVASSVGRLRFVQIAGLVARRIVCWKKEGDEVAAGERIGLIQFGSRVDVHLPPGILPTVRIGSRVQGGSTLLARTGSTGLREEGGAHAQSIGR